MEPTNFSRQFIKNATDTKYDIKTVNCYIKDYNTLLKDNVLMLHKSQKFILPENGICVEDKELKGIDESLELKLPFEQVCLEYWVYAESGEKTKCIHLLRELSDGIEISLLIFTYSTWFIFPCGKIPKKNYLDRKEKKTHIKAKFADYFMEPLNSVVYRSIDIVFYFLNALACSNVKTQKLYAKQPRKQKKNSLPFDDYHILMLTNKSSNGTHGNHSEHRSPREHLRRGHIRRCHSGVTTWINSMVVNAGTKGKVTKDYKI